MEEPVVQIERWANVAFEDVIKSEKGKDDDAG